MKWLASWVLVLQVAATASAQFADNDVLVRALQDEMDRSLAELQLEDGLPPYFISYSIQERHTSSLTYVLGAHNGTNSSHVRVLAVNVRVGSKQLDNTNFLLVEENPNQSDDSGVVHVLPLTDDYDELRRVIWVATDQAYKSALAHYSAKTSAIASQTDVERPNDFSDEKPYEYVDERPTRALELDRLADLARQVSTVFRGRPELFSSYANAFSITTRRTYLDSESNFHVYSTELCGVRTHAHTQTSTGAIIKDGTSVLARDCSELSDIESLKADAVHMAEHLVVQREAETLDAYTGPVYLESQAAAEFINQALAGLLVAVPVPMTGNFQFDVQIQNIANQFIHRIGTRVFPRNISVVNDPTIDERNGRLLLGSYTVDSEGMPSRRTELIANGILKNLLTTRSPVGGLVVTTGSNRGLPIPLPGNLLLQTDQGISQEAIREQLFDIARSNGSDFAMAITKIANTQEIEMAHVEMSEIVSATMEGNIAVLPAIHLVKLYPDGRQVPVQPMVIEDFVPAHFREIVATTEESHQHDVPVSPLTGMNVLMAIVRGPTALSGYDQTYSSIVTPGLLFEDMTLRIASGQKPRLPIVPHPMSSE